LLARVEYLADDDKWGEPDVWQSPALTLFDGTGDCEDMTLALWSAAPFVGLPTGRMAIGTYEGDGHAWAEFPEVGLWAEATSGEVGYLGHGPSPYRPLVYVYANGTCELANLH